VRIRVGGRSATIDRASRQADLKRQGIIMDLHDLDTLLTPYEARNQSLRRLETLRDLGDVSRLEIKLVGIGRDETGTAGRVVEVWLKEDEARRVIETAKAAVQQTLDGADSFLRDLGGEATE
jgi:hypothetical protein